MAAAKKLAPPVARKPLPAPNLQAELDRLRAENAALKARPATAAPRLTMKVSGKGAMSLYGLMRFPVTLYKEQWIRLLDLADEIRQFLVDNEASLSVKE